MLTEKYNEDSILEGGLGNTSAFFGSPEFTPHNNSWDWASPTEIPDATYGVGSKFPQGPAGAVSHMTNNKTNFAWADGHAKSMDAVATDPDPINRPGDDRWDSTR